MDYDVVIIGGGAAGLFCAAVAGKRGRKTLVIEHNSQPGRKIIISGGGRCNFTNVYTRPENFVSQNPHFCKSALARYTPQDFIGLVKRHRIEFYEKKLGQLFCRERSSLIVEMLLAECHAAGAEVITGTSVKSVSKSSGFRVETNRGEYTCDSLVVASGGLSFPKVGATDIGYRIADQFGLRIEPTVPSLVPLVFANGGFRELAGVSIDSTVSTGDAAFRENMLFTHRGLSGPAILQISNYWRPGKTITVDLMPEHDAGELILSNRRSRQQLDNFISQFVPKRFAERFLPVEMGRKPLDQLSNKEIEQAAKLLNGWQVKFNETEGYAKAEVTAGGIATAELSSQTMESVKVPGLYFIGEVVDVTGWLGGYNFQWAWSSAFAAGQTV